MFRVCRRWRDSSTGHECDRAKHCLRSIHDCLDPNAKDGLARAAAPDLSGFLPIPCARLFSLTGASARPLGSDYRTAVLWHL
jgi:hypothetical protein